MEFRVEGVRVGVECSVLKVQCGRFSAWGLGCRV